MFYTANGTKSLASASSAMFLPFWCSSSSQRDAVGGSTVAYTVALPMFLGNNAGRVVAGARSINLGRRNLTVLRKCPVVWHEK